MIAASGTDPAAIATQAVRLASVAPDGLVIQMSDCRKERPIFAFAAKITPSLELAEAALQRVRRVVKDAHLKKCDIKPGSLLALRCRSLDCRSTKGFGQLGGY